MDTWFAQLFEAERQKGRDEGIAEARAEGIQALVDVYRNEMHLDNDTILSKIISKFQISRDYAISLL